MTDVLVVAELIDGGLRKTTLNAISAARTIAQGTGGAFDVLAIGAGAPRTPPARSPVTAPARCSPRKSLAATAPRPTRPRSLQLGKGYGVVVATASTYGKDLLPRVAAKLDAGLASDISKVNVDGGKLSYKRPIYAGNVYATMEVTTPIQVVTVRQSEFEPARRERRREPGRRARCRGRSRPPARSSS